MSADAPSKISSQTRTRSRVVLRITTTSYIKQTNVLTRQGYQRSSNAPRRLVNILQHGVFSRLSLPSFVVGARVVHSVEELAFAREVIQEYLSLGAIEPCSLFELRFSVPWFVVSKVEPSGSIKRRFIANMRPINKFIACSPFKFDHWGIVFPMLRKGMHAAKVDLSHAYFHVPLLSNFARYVGVEVDGSCYHFRGLPFGLNASPQIFGSFMRVLSRLWRERGLMVFVYMDDIMILGSTYAECRASVAVVRSAVEEAGFLVKAEKSSFEPSRVVKFLGVEADFERGVISIESVKAFEKTSVNWLRVNKCLYELLARYWEKSEVYWFVSQV